MTFGLIVRSYGEAVYLMADYVNDETGIYSHAMTQEEARRKFHDAVKKVVENHVEN